MRVAIGQDALRAETATVTTAWQANGRPFSRVTAGSAFFVWPCDSEVSVLIVGGFITKTFSVLHLFLENNVISNYEACSLVKALSRAWTRVCYTIKTTLETFSFELLLISPQSIKLYNYQEYKVTFSDGSWQQTRITNSGWTRFVTCTRATTQTPEFETEVFKLSRNYTYSVWPTHHFVFTTASVRGNPWLHGSI